MSRWSRLKRLSKNSADGFTLVELLIAITLTALIATAVAMIFDASMEAWRFGEEIASIETVVPDLMNKISEGDYVSAGIVDALAVTSADKNGISFVPLAIERFKVNSSADDGQFFELGKPFQLGAPLPKGQIRLPGERFFQNVQTEFHLGKDEKPPQEKDRIRFLEPISEDSEVRVVYRPDYAKVPEAVMTFRWNPESKSVVREHEGFKLDLSENSLKVEVTNMEFQYFSNTNAQIIAKDPSGVLDESERQLITAAKIICSVKKGGTEKTFTQFVNMRNLSASNVGIVIKEGDSIKIPNSKLIKSLSIVNVFGVEGKSVLQLRVESQFGNDWVVALTYDIVDEKPMLVKYQVEYPAGKVVVEKVVSEPASKAFSLLKLDDEGKYDYDNDEGIEDVVNFEDEDVTLQVETMEVGGAAIHVRP